MPPPVQARPDSTASAAKDTATTIALTSATDAPAVSPHLSNLELTLAAYLLTFAILLVVIEAVIIRISRIESEAAVRLVSVTLILVSILYLTTAGYGSQQITAATGLLGTIAGYLLGRNSGRPAPPPNSDQPAGNASANR